MNELGWQVEATGISVSRMAVRELDVGLATESQAPARGAQPLPR